MADYQRFPQGDRHRDGGSNRFRDQRLDDRTGSAPGSPGGYRASRGQGGQQAGYGQRAYGDYGRDDAEGATYGGFEDRSFAEEAARDGGYYGTASGGQDAYGGRAPVGAHDRPSGGWDRDHSYGASSTYRGGYSQGGGRGRESYDFNPYQNYEADRGRHERDNDRRFLDRAGDRVSSLFGDQAARERLRGDHAGRGPKGYRRSDDRIREDVSDRLADDSWLDASDVEVTVADCEVTLTGQVSDRDSKRRAEALAEGASGVTHVQNNLRVTQSRRSLHDDRSMSDQAQAQADTANGHNAALTKQAAGRD